jgi:hypothetical protein
VAASDRLARAGGDPDLVLPKMYEAMLANTEAVRNRHGRLDGVPLKDHESANVYISCSRGSSSTARRILLSGQQIFTVGTCCYRKSMTSFTGKSFAGPDAPSLVTGVKSRPDIFLR